MTCRLSRGGRGIALFVLGLAGAGALPGCLIVHEGPDAAHWADDDGARGRAEAEINRVLADWHDAAADADLDRYFGHMGPGTVFLGTDASERWSLEEFRAFARPYFERGRAWTYVPRSRHVMVGPCGRAAWFDEVLDNESFGQCRGTGTMVFDPEAERWRIAHYNLTVPVPNELLDDVVRMIRERDASPPTGGRS